MAAVISRTLATWKTPHLEWGFAGWLDFVDDCKALEAEEAQELTKQHLAEQLHEETQRGADCVKKEADRRLQMCASAVKRMFHIQLATAFDSFCDRVAECREKKATCKRLILRMLRLHLAGAFDGFVLAVQELAAHRRLVSKTVSRWQAPMKQVAFDLWLDYLGVIRKERTEEG